MTGEIQATLSGWRINLPQPICKAMEEAKCLSHKLIPTYGAECLRLVPAIKLDEYRELLRKDWGYSENLINQLTASHSSGIQIERGRKKRFTLPSAPAKRQKIQKDGVISLFWKEVYLEVWAPEELDLHIKSLFKPE